MAQQKILIVDDEAGMRELLGDLLADMQCDLFFAKDGVEGLKMAEEVKPDVMLLDIMLPGMDGYQLCKTLRSRADLAAIPVIMVTGHDTEDSARKGIEVGAEDVLAKPFNMSELKLRLRTILQLNRYRLMASERSQFKWVVEHSESGYIMLNMQNRVTYLNPCAQSFLGLTDFSPEDAASLFDLVDGKFERVPDTAWEHWPLLPEKSFLVRPENAERQAVWLRVEAVPSDEHADQRILRLHDVSEDMLMFQNMWQFENMVSHKLRTPLNIITGALDALDANRDSLGGEENIGYITEAMEATQRLNDSIRGVLDHLSSRKNKDELQPITTSLGTVENYANQLAMTQGIQKIKVNLEAPLRMRELKLANEDVIQIFQELYDNSLKFHPQRTPTVSVDIVGKNENLVTLRIIDDGRNVDALTLQKIGTPFYQAEKHFTGEIPGMGLGLSMISTLLTTIGGACRFRNREDKAGLAIELDVPLVSEG